MIKILVVAFIFAVAADRFFFNGRYATTAVQIVHQAVVYR